MVFSIPELAYCKESLLKNEGSLEESYEKPFSRQKNILIGQIRQIHRPRYKMREILHTTDRRTLYYTTRQKGLSEVFATCRGILRGTLKL